MWNKNRSLLLSKIFVLFFLLCLVLCIFFSPFLVTTLRNYSHNAYQADYWYFIATIYSGVLPAGLLLWSLLKMLNNIGKGEVFVQANVTHMRLISWCCFAGGIITGISAAYYLPWLAVALAAAFVGLIVRVVKNVVAEATALKEENDFTI